MNNHGAIWSILGTGSPGYSAFIARLDCCCVNGNCAFNMQSRHSCVNNNGAMQYIALWRRHVSLLQCEKGINHIKFMPRLACKPFGDIHSICPQANTPILVSILDQFMCEIMWYTHSMNYCKVMVNASTDTMWTSNTGSHFGWMSNCFFSKCLFYCGFCLFLGQTLVYHLAY